jgi:hypothetical protein
LADAGFEGRRLLDPESGGPDASDDDPLAGADGDGATDHPVLGGRRLTDRRPAS